MVKRELVVWKFPLTLAARQALVIPRGFRVLHVDWQPEPAGAQLWALVDPSRDAAPVDFYTIGTGQPVDASHAYVGTWQHGGFVWHVFTPKGTK